jgi:hypothetical protein
MMDGVLDTEIRVGGRSWVLLSWRPLVNPALRAVSDALSLNGLRICPAGWALAACRGRGVDYLNGGA